jgi:hypothetical protein
VRNNNINEGKKSGNTDMVSVNPILLLWSNFRSGGSFLHPKRKNYNNSEAGITSDSFKSYVLHITKFS